MQLCTVLAICCFLLVFHVRPSLSQSCVAAGYTGCCDQETDPNSCAGAPLGFCFCDPTCHGFNDCCEDITDICHPEKEELFSVLKPQVTYMTSVIYQSATVHWVSRVYTNDTNKTDIQPYYKLHLSSPSAETFSVNVIVSSSNDTGRSEEYALRLSGLDPNTTYSYNLSAFTWFGELEFGTMGSFTTLDSSSLCIKGIHLAVLESSSVQVTWTPLSLLPGVTVTDHVIQYRELPLGQEGTRLVTSNSYSHVVSELQEGVRYSFIVKAAIAEEGGRQLAIGDCGERQVHMPASGLFQLTVVGAFSSHCSYWEREDEQTLVLAFRYSILQMLQDSVHPNFPVNNVQSDYVICHSATLTLQGHHEHRLTYRGTIFSTDSISVEELISSIQEWTNLNGELVVQDHLAEATPLTTPLMLVDSNCPVEVRTKAHPLCKDDLLTSTPATEDGVCISVPIFAASISAVFLFLLVVTMMIIICMLLRTQDKRAKHSVTTEAIQSTSPPLYNVYAPNPINTETMATRTQDHAPSRPMAIRVTESASSGPIVSASQTGDRQNGSHEDSGDGVPLSREPAAEFHSGSLQGSEVMSGSQGSDVVRISTTV